MFYNYSIFVFTHVLTTMFCIFNPSKKTLNDSPRVELRSVAVTNVLDANRRNKDVFPTPYSPHKMICDKKFSHYFKNHSKLKNIFGQKNDALDKFKWTLLYLLLWNFYCRHVESLDLTIQMND